MILQWYSDCIVPFSNIYPCNRDLVFINVIYQKVAQTQNTEYTISGKIKEETSIKHTQLCDKQLQLLSTVASLWVGTKTQIHLLFVWVCIHELLRAPQPMRRPPATHTPVITVVIMCRASVALSVHSVVPAAMIMLYYYLPLSLSYLSRANSVGSVSQTPPQLCTLQTACT